jgi:hypothetical protein
MCEKNVHAEVGQKHKEDMFSRPGTALVDQPIDGKSDREHNTHVARGRDRS